DTDGGRNLRQQAEALDELRLDAQDPPGVGVHPIGGTTMVQEPLIGGGPGDGAPPVGQGSRSSYSFFILHALQTIRIAPAHTCTAHNQASTERRTGGRSAAMPDRRARRPCVPRPPGSC